MFVDPIGPGETRSSDIFSPGTAAPDCEDVGLENVSSLVDVHAKSKNAISKTRAAVSAACLITNPNLFAGHLRCNQPQETQVTKCAYNLN
jgi:hypothetical protein